MTDNIRHRFAQSGELARTLVLFFILLACSPFSFSQNLLTNPGFESGTSGWTLDGDASAQFTESNGRSGSRLTHWSSSSSYTAETKQAVTGLAAGTYRLSAYTVGGETAGAWLWAYCDGESFSTPIPSSPWGNWAQVAVDNILVSGGSCELGITTENSEWSSFDDVVFEWVSGGGPGELVIEEGTGFCDVDGSVDSNHSGYNGSGFANTDNAMGNGVEWRVQVPAGGSYQLEWRYANTSDNNRAGSVVVNGNAVATVDFPSTGAWTSWASSSANIALSAGENTIRLEAVSGEGLGNIDSLSVTGDSPQAVDCGGSPPGGVFKPDYILGAAITWTLEHESIGRSYSDQGQTKSIERILVDHGFNFARLRTFVCPECPGGYLDNLYSGAGPTENWGDTAHTIELAQRVKACGMGVFLDFMLSDTWASIGKQYRPSQWQGMSDAQIRAASYNHAKDVLDQMVAAGVKPDMVQCGNENNTHVSGYSYNDWAGFSGVINSCIRAVRETDPEITVVAHHGRPRPDGDFPFWVDRVFGSNPPIDADVVCGSTYGTTNNGGDWWDMFNYVIDTTGKPVMSCEYTDGRRDLVNNTFLSLPNDMGVGTFIWEPAGYGDRRPFNYSNGVYYTNSSMDEYARIAREAGLPVPSTPASQLQGTSCQ
ncbi:glycosyl hydrolase 53 family protein [Microbulbifer rhizosphaerae]|uniref:Arabinogalactan endo-beta-1,4-galactanase n=1 Tax=Microbulbifer rhizosphaerae TaxID=1562603 RepID=A0A7W4ZAM8_9GAMM|nr:glycosyl hydrolase 53 family protein [Microbulbifer rhizosphaerae]MBB3062726.1 arabinogalactan endo-1,4-beta-galactosidase [Microbulbifer rhizosphaerae]